MVFVVFGFDSQPPIVLIFQNYKNTEKRKSKLLEKDSMNLDSITVISFSNILGIFSIHIKNVVNLVDLLSEMTSE